tara:strand:+ start:11114 stop:11311 length:198 start_codon:yes stop_codon:yes gene_type:complete
MTTPDLSEVGARLEKAVEHLATLRPEDDRLQLYEDAAIAILDSEHTDYPEGQLESYLMHYLQQLQ